MKTLLQIDQWVIQ